MVVKFDKNDLKSSKFQSFFLYFWAIQRKNSDSSSARNSVVISAVEFGLLPAIGKLFKEFVISPEVADQPLNDLVEIVKYSAALDLDMRSLKDVFLYLSTQNTFKLIYEPMVEVLNGRFSISKDRFWLVLMFNTKIFKHNFPGLN